MQLNALGFTRSGYYVYSNGGLGYQSSYGYYWSRTRGGAAYAHYLRFVATALYPRYNDYRGYGYALRCLTR